MRLRTIVVCAVVLTACGAASADAQPSVTQPDPWPFGQAQKTPAPPRASTQQIQGFNIVLVLGETQASGASESVEDLPGGAKKALSDMREFLPYKHYRVLDSQWTSCCGGARAQLSGRLRGLVGVPGANNAVNLVHRPYAFALEASNSADGLAIHFELKAEEVEGVRRLTDRDTPRERADLQAEIETLGLQIREAEGKVKVGALAPLDVRPLQDRHASLQRRLEGLGGETRESGSRSIIQTRFSMEPGETVVVGTSRLGGDKALIALVTAVRRTGGKE
jgi:hypothetical protein